MILNYESATTIMEAPRGLLSDYAFYCTDKIEMNEIPFTFEIWVQATNDMKDNQPLNDN